MSDAPVYCRATLNYADDESSVAVETDILDGRAVDLPGWSVCGFELMNLATQVTDWTDESAVLSSHLDEAEGYARDLSGCDAVLFYPPLVRSRSAARIQPDLAPIQFVHSDYTEAYRSMIGDQDHPYHEVLKPSMERAGISAEDVRSASRVLTLQFWRNIGEPDIDYPLALCDARTVPRDRLQPVRVAEYGGLVTDFDAFAVAPPDHGEYDWYTFPHLSGDEVLVFRAFDSQCVERGEPFWTPHTSFRDPNMPPDAPGRKSVEARAVCLFN